MPESDRIETIEQLEALYGEPQPLAIAKEIDHISPPLPGLYRKGALCCRGDVWAGRAGLLAQGRPGERDRRHR